MTNINIIFGNQYQKRKKADIQDVHDSIHTQQQKTEEECVDCCCDCWETALIQQTHSRG